MKGGGNLSHHPPVETMGLIHKRWHDFENLFTHSNTYQHVM
jgi:hypothetical protein